MKWCMHENPKRNISFHETVIVKDRPLYWTVTFICESTLIIIHVRELSQDESFSNNHLLKKERKEEKKRERKRENILE